MHWCGRGQVAVGIHPQVVLDFIGVFTALNDEQQEVLAPGREREDQQGQQEDTERLHARLLGRVVLTLLAKYTRARRHGSRRTNARGTAPEVRHPVAALEGTDTICCPLSQALALAPSTTQNSLSDLLGPVGDA